MRAALALAVLAITSSAIAAPRKGATEIKLGRDVWTVTAPGAKHLPARYHHGFRAASWAIVVKEWPTSSVFIQSLDGQLEAMRARDPALVVLQQEQRTKSDWVLVVEVGRTVRGVVRRPGGSSNATCTFSTDARSWKPALTACRSLEYTRRARMSMRVPIDYPSASSVSRTPG
jgi:hypothetical protein